MLHACFFLKPFSIIIFVNIPSKTKVIDRDTYISQFTLIKNEQIHNAFFIAVKTMINNVLFLVNSAKEGITFCHIHAYLTMFTITFK